VDTAYYDRLTETIVGVALVKPRPGVFQPYVKRLLVVITCVEVVILGVTFSAGPAGNELLNLIPEPVFQLATDNVTVTTTIGTESGRIFQVQTIHDNHRLVCDYLLRFIERRRRAT
jgi:nuclear pore complex protein Nup155